MRSSLMIFSYCLPRTTNPVDLHNCVLSRFSPLPLGSCLLTRHSSASGLDYSSPVDDDFIPVANFRMVTFTYHLLLRASWRTVVDIAIRKPDVPMIIGITSNRTSHGLLARSQLAASQGGFDKQTNRMTLLFA